jgi:hypothetical protein
MRDKVYIDKVYIEDALGERTCSGRRMMNAASEAAGGNASLTVTTTAR